MTKQGIVGEDTGYAENFGQLILSMAILMGVDVLAGWLPYPPRPRSHWCST